MKYSLFLVGCIAVLGLAYRHNFQIVEFECPDGHCLSDLRFGDGSNNFGDWNDEPEDCPPCRRQCPNGYCIPDWWICDGFSNCGDWRDEPENCSPCQWRCPNENCIPELFPTYTHTKPNTSTLVLTPTHTRFTKSI